MELPIREPMKDSALRNLKVLALLPPSNPDLARWMLRMLAGGKDRWNWDNYVLALDSAKPAAAKVVPENAIFLRPHILAAAPWEADPQRVAEVDRLMADAEKKTHVPVGYLVAAAQSSIGRAYVVAARHRLGSSMADEVLRDNTQPFRIMRRFFGFAESMLSACNPDVILAIEWATPLHAAIWLSAASRGIPLLAARRSKIHAGRAYWTADRFMLNERGPQRAAALRAAGAPASDAALEYIEKFRQQPAVSSYVNQKWSHVGKKWRQSEILAWARVPVKMARAAAIKAIERARGYDLSGRPSIFERCIAPRRRAYLARKHRRFMSVFDETALAKIKYIYFPMHKETDLPLVFQANAWCDQRHTVQLLASSLPSDCKLFVREHRANYGQRSTEYYEHLQRLPNVVIVDPFDSQFKYLRHADLIVTENGSSGWEGLLLRRRVMLVAPNFYDGAGLGYRVYDPNRLSAAICEALAEPQPADDAAYDHCLGHMIDGEMETSFVSDLDDAMPALNALAPVVADILVSKESPAPPTARMPAAAIAAS